MGIMLATKLVEAFRTEWSSPAVLTPSKDGNVHSNDDYRKVNAITIRNSYSIPIMDKSIDSVADAHVFQL